MDKFGSVINRINSKFLKELRSLPPSSVCTLETDL
jgi:hypothetical protein